MMVEKYKLVKGSRNFCAAQHAAFAYAAGTARARTRAAAARPQIADGLLIASDKNAIRLP
jgi:hypothetical protein